MLVMPDSGRSSQVIDAHHHLWRYNAEEYGWISPEMSFLQRNFSVADLLPSMRNAQVDGTVVVQARQSLEETRWLLAIAQESPEVRGVVGWAPLASGDVRQTLLSFRDFPKLKGLRHVVQDEPDPNFLLREDFNRGIASLLDAGLAYDILVRSDQLAAARSFAAQHPQQRFVLDHLAKPRVKAHLEPWRTDLLRLAELPNVYAKLSGLVTEADWKHWTAEDLWPYLDTALKAFGAERLIAGSDWPVCLLASSYERWWSTLHAWIDRAAPAAKAEIMGATASQVYRVREL